MDFSVLKVIEAGVDYGNRADYSYLMRHADQRGDSEKEGPTFVLHVGGSEDYQASRIAGMRAAECSDDLVDLYHTAVGAGADKLFIHGAC